MIICHFKGTACTSPQPMMALGFLPAFGMAQKGKCIHFYPRDFKWIIAFSGVFGLEQGHPCEREVWQHESMCGQVYGTEYFSPNLAREAVAHIAGSIRQESPLIVKSPSLPPLSPFFPSPQQKAHPTSRTSSATSATKWRERRLKTLKTYGKLGLNRK